MTFAAKSFASFLAVWIIINSIVLRMRPFDPYPFILLNQLLSCLAAIQAPVIMMSQNRQEAKDRVRAEHDYRVNLKAELDISKGRRNKFELDKATGLLKLDRCLYSSSHIPGDYGYVPQTLAEGGDAPDVLVMVNEPTFTGCLIKARVVGLFRMTDRRSNDYKVLSVLEGRPLNRRARRTARRRCTKLRRQLRGSATRPDRRAINDHGRTASRARPCIPFSRRNRYRNAGHAEHVESTDDLWWKFAFHGNVPRSLRALAGAATVVFAVTLVRLFRAQPPTPGLPTAEEVDCGRTIVAASPRTSANLALLGDKHFLFNGDRSALVMFGIEGRSGFRWAIRSARGQRPMHWRRTFASLGFFSPDYIRRCPIALIRHAGRIVAFSCPPMARGSPSSSSTPGRVRCKCRREAFPAAAGFLVVAHRRSER